MTEKQRAYLYLHISVFLWGFTAILGALISLEALPLVWWRVVLAGSGLLLLGRLPLLKELSQIPRSTLFQLIWIGILIGIHWLCFYGAIKKANASIAVVAMATTSFFSALVEPFFLKKKIEWWDVGIGLLILPGVYLIADGIDWSMQKGFIMGVVAALLAAIFSVWNKKVVDSPNAPGPRLMSLVQLWTIALFLPLYLSLKNLNDCGNTVIQAVMTPILLTLPKTVDFTPTYSDWFWLIVLAFACTLLPFILSLISLKHISAFASNLTINLEPVYGVVLAGLILHEHKELSMQFYIGVCIILAAVFLHPLLNKSSK